MHRTTCKTFLFVVAGVLLLQSAALAGPPLICHPFNIADAKSLPFQGPAWSRVDPDYDTRNLVRDTVSLLGNDVPVIVRMETLRRATLYSRNDAKLAAALLVSLRSRAEKSASTGEGGGAVMASFDLAYLAETYREAGLVSRASNETAWKFAQMVPAVDGYAIIQKLIAKGGGPEMEFAAALITADKRNSDYFDHVRKATAAAKPGSLLAQNLASHLGPDLKSAKLEMN
jgi:hypothetical protein